MLEAKNLGYRYPASSWALGGLDLEFPPASVSVLLGHNGSGKTSVLRLIAGLLPVASGEIRWQGVDIRGLSPRARARIMAYAPQHLEVGHPFSLLDFVLMGTYSHSGFMGAVKAEQVGKAKELLASWNMEDLRNRPVKTLSGGERQKALLLQALMQDAPVLLLDEPSSSLDPVHRREIARILKDLAGAGKTVVAVLHDLEIASDIADRVFALRGGRLVAQGSAHEVLRDDLLREIYGNRIYEL